MTALRRSICFELAWGMAFQGLREECEQRLAVLIDEDSVLEVLLFAESRNFSRLLEAGESDCKPCNLGVNPITSCVC